MTGPAYRSSTWRRLALAVIERDGYVCQIKGPRCTTIATSADHIEPTSMGGAMFDPANLRASCAHCNASLGARLRNARYPTRVARGELRL
jgi:5-methylcytosine-specific restriction endonuclease McrA